MEIGPIVLLGVVVFVILVARSFGIRGFRRTPVPEFELGARLKVTRNVTRAECPWLCRDIQEGTFVFKFRGPIYGAISEDGTGVSFGGASCFELPADSLVEAPESHESSNDARDKLRAVLNHAGPHHESKPSPDFIAACRKWNTALSARDEALAEIVRDSFERGDEVAALKAVAALPPAPVCSSKLLD